MNEIAKLLLYALAIAIVFTFVQRQFFPKIETETKTVTTIDTTKVDSLYSVIEFLENIEPEDQDTVRDTVYIPQPTIEDSIKTYRTGLSDSTISISVISDINISTSDLVSQQIEYILKQRLVRRERLEMTYNINTINTITTTRTIHNSFVSAGAIVNQQSIIPSVGYTTRGGITFLYGYDIQNNAHTAGILTPIF